MVKNIVNMLNLKKDDAQHDNNGSWCTLLIDNNKVTAKIRHVGRKVQDFGSSKWR